MKLHSLLLVQNFYGDWDIYKYYTGTPLADIEKDAYTESLVNENTTYRIVLLEEQKFESIIEDNYANPYITFQPDFESRYLFRNGKKELSIMME